MIEHLAIVNWPRAGKDGKPDLPHALRYTGISRFETDGAQWPDGAYSVVCAFESPLSEHGTPIEAKVRFLADQAPHERLAAGVKFHLYEGPHEVARIEVLW